MAAAKPVVRNLPGLAGRPFPRDSVSRRDGKAATPVRRGQVDVHANLPPAITSRATGKERVQNQGQVTQPGSAAVDSRRRLGAWPGEKGRSGRREGDEGRREGGKEQGNLRAHSEEQLQRPGRQAGGVHHSTPLQ